MRAAQFNWLTTVDDLEVQDTKLEFTLSHKNQYDEVEHITAHIELDSKTIDVEDQFKPEHGYEIEVPTVKTRIATVYDMDGVLAIEGQPFELTAEQHRTLNEYLDELVTL